MGKQLIRVTSITYAMKAKTLLSNYGISAYIQRTPREFRDKSCGYSLHVPYRILDAIDILNNHGIRMLGTSGIEEIK
ncbi:hypothetical protein AGMMS50284_3670 [Clostridia bacterium]|nr:hypothetical protein AGMMS50284_3670 [Clostridia bacterium]